MDKSGSSKTKFDNKAKGDRKPASRRLMFIDFRLKFVGSVQRAVLQKQFGISPQQATKDLKAYLELAPQNMEYSVWEKAYIPTAKFKPAFKATSLKRYLRRLTSLAGGQKREREWVGDHVNVAVATTPMRLPDEKVLNKVLKAINESMVIEVTYVSMNSGRNDQRLLAPHALCSDGKRWHTRAWDFDNSEYRDFVFGRILSASVKSPIAEELPTDTDWETTCDIVVSPAKALTNGARKVIAAEYLMEDNRLVVTTSKAMLFYALRELGFNPRDIDDSGMMRNVSFLNLEIKNLKEVEANLERRPATSDAKKRIKSAG